MAAGGTTVSVAQRHSSIDNEMKVLMDDFESSTGCCERGIIWRSFYKTIERLDLVSTPEVETADAVKGKPVRYDVL